MVSLWPWGGEDSSPASFEKALSGLAKKITETQAKLERMRIKSRKAKVLGTLYLSFAYLVYAIVLLLVVGYKDLGPYEWTGMAGGPVVIYTARQVITGYYNFVIDTLEARLNEHQEERAKTIQKLKDATKYDSTMELIEKYGGPDGRPKSRGQESAYDGSERAPSVQGTPSRTHIPPPATANIQRREGPQARFRYRPSSTWPPPPQPDHLEPTAEFAPNAFGNGSLQPPPPQIYVTGPPEPHWYDRIFDVLLGEDETAAKNRIVLICKSCRLVNGQAPPGTKTLAELGTWRCMACGAPNGEMDEGKRIVREVLATKEADKKEKKGELSPSMKEIGDEDAEGDSTGLDSGDSPAAAVKARRTKGSK
ncbi:hypothetical protein PT974_01532 [Cladobotryum mycophilum]|uniref:Endoplasmic reticulum junction formation protein lunapark n=1 Tax=Cladobotryum mycophilum TaxID=491253 RepID=A0ABR0T3U4_9HYPO